MAVDQATAERIAALYVEMAETRVRCEKELTRLGRELDQIWKQHHTDLAVAQAARRTTATEDHRHG